VTASFSALTWLPVSVTGPGFEYQKRRSAHFPASSCRALNGPNKPLGHLRTRADLVEIVLRRFLGDGLFHDHRTSAIHLRNRFPRRHCVERLTTPECLDQCFCLACYFLAEFWSCLRRSGPNQKIAKVGVIAIPASSRRAGTFGFRPCRWCRRLCRPFAFHIQSSSPRFIGDPSPPAAAPSRAFRPRSPAPSTRQLAIRWGFLPTASRATASREIH
jgi:hypothetical protein